jgi:hypothetical protein
MKIDRYYIQITDDEYLIIDRLHNGVEALCYTMKTADLIVNTLNGDKPTEGNETS